MIVVAAVNTNTSIDFAFFSASACVTAAIANICRRRMLLKAYNPIRFCRVKKLKRDWRKVANKTRTSLIANKIGLALFSRVKIKIINILVSYITLSHTCDPFDPGSVNVPTYLHDNLWRDRNIKSLQCDPCLT